MRLAETGQLTYGKTADVYRCQEAELVLELRFSKRVQYPNGTRAVRLYFSELDCKPGQLLAAHMAAKPATKAGLKVQNVHMGEAQLRIEAHLGI